MQLLGMVFVSQSHVRHENTGKLESGEPLHENDPTGRKRVEKKQKTAKNALGALLFSIITSSRGRRIPVRSAQAAAPLDRPKRRAKREVRRDDKKEKSVERRETREERRDYQKEKSDETERREGEQESIKERREKKESKKGEEKREETREERLWKSKGNKVKLTLGAPK